MAATPTVLRRWVAVLAGAVSNPFHHLEPLTHDLERVEHSCSNSRAVLVLPDHPALPFQRCVVSTVLASLAGVVSRAQMSRYEAQQRVEHRRDRDAAERVAMHSHGIIVAGSRPASL